MVRKDFLMRTEKTMNDTYNARYSKLSCEVRQGDWRIQYKIWIDPFVTTGGVRVDTCEMVRKCNRADRMVNKLCGYTLFDNEREKLCRANLVRRYAVNFPNSPEANVQFVKKNAMIWYYVFRAADIAAQKVFRLLFIIKSRKAINFPPLMWSKGRINAIGFQVNDISQTGCFYFAPRCL